MHRLDSTRRVDAEFGEQSAHALFDVVAADGDDDVGGSYHLVGPGLGVFAGASARPASRSPQRAGSPLFPARAGRPVGRPSDPHPDHLVADREHRIAQGLKEFIAGYSRWALVVVWDGLEEFRRGAELFNCSANGFFAHLLVSPWAVLRVIVCPRCSARSPQSRGTPPLTIARSAPRWRPPKERRAFLVERGGDLKFARRPVIPLGGGPTASEGSPS